MTFETYIGGEKIEEITPEIRKYITDQFIKAFGSRVEVIRREGGEVSNESTD
jgi:hypothetical protein